LPPGTAVRCRPYSITYSGHPIAAHISLDDPPSSVAGWWPNIGNLNSTTCARTTLRMCKILHIYLPNGFSVSLQEPQLGMEKPETLVAKGKLSFGRRNADPAQLISQRQ
jgi:hypothetical protein